MSEKKPRGSLSDADKKIWGKVTENITKLESNRARSPLVRKSAYAVHFPSSAYGQKGIKAPAERITRPPRDLKDADFNWHQKLRGGQVKPEGKVDLHGLSQDRAYAVLHHYIEEAQRRGKRVILVVTGKGGLKSDYGAASHSDFMRDRGILKVNVPRWLSERDLACRIVSYYSARSEHGGDGALYVVLKKIRT